MLFCFRIKGEKFVSTIVQYHIPWRKGSRSGLLQRWLHDSPEHTGNDARSPSDWLEGLCYSCGIVRRGERCVLSKYPALSSAVGGSATGGLHLEGTIQSDCWDGLIKHFPSGRSRFLMSFSSFSLRIPTLWFVGKKVFYIFVIYWKNILHKCKNAFLLSTFTCCVVFGILLPGSALPVYERVNVLWIRVSEYRSSFLNNPKSTDSKDRKSVMKRSEGTQCSSGATYQILTKLVCHRALQGKSSNQAPSCSGAHDWRLNFPKTVCSSFLFRFRSIEREFFSIDPTHSEPYNYSKKISSASVQPFIFLPERL